MKIKVCGLRDPKNISALTSLGIDYMGFIFYDKSPRYMAEILPPSFMELVPEHLKKVGVFVNETAENMILLGKKFHLQCVQLHGSETPETCAKIKEAGFEVFKAFPVDEDFDFTATEPYLDITDFFLFDTKTVKHGGSGVQFDWDVLGKFKYDKPFFLSGGIGPADSSALMRFQHPNFYGIDINSKFETEPGIKDISELSMFLFQLKQDDL